MEQNLLGKLHNSAKEIGLIEPTNGRLTLPINPKGEKWKTRNPEKLKGLVWHQKLGWGTIEAIVRYHTGPDSHLHSGGVESIAYTWAIRRDGQLVLCNDFIKATWSQGYSGREGDKNDAFMSVLFEGLFNGPDVTNPTAGEPNEPQITSSLLLWRTCRQEYGWEDDALFGHYHFGKRSCPGNTLQSVVEAIMLNTDKPKYNFSTVKGRQRALKKLGYYKGKIDGIWGPGSKGALIRFQADHGLEPDGIWGNRSEIAVNIFIRSK